MNCWICGKVADSREHITKASDIRIFFGDISPKTPLYLHNDSHKNISIHSAKSNKIKTKNKVICKRCNDTHTANSDNSWSELLKYIHGNWNQIKTKEQINLKKIFPGQANSKALNFHLYFVKLFGCRIIDEKLPIKIDEFSYSVKNKKAHETLYLTFNYWFLTKGALYLGPSQIETKVYNGSIEMATWFYSIGELDVQITWFKNKPEKNVPKAWHPNDKGNIIKFRRR